MPPYHDDYDEENDLRSPTVDSTKKYPIAITVDLDVPPTNPVRERRRVLRRVTIRRALWTIAATLLAVGVAWFLWFVWAYIYYNLGSSMDYDLSKLLPDGALDAIEGNNLTDVPDYVLKYAPLVYLHPDEKYHPSDLATQVDKCVLRDKDNNDIKNVPEPLTLDNLHLVNNLTDDPEHVYLSTPDGIAHPEPWWTGVVPDKEKGGETVGAKSTVIVVVEKGEGWVDAFYLYFYGYNRGGKIMGTYFGDHLGDWEQNMIRFQNGVPKAVWYSQHSGGEAFTYECLHKLNERPLAWSAIGTHANYATKGKHDHFLPNHNLPIGLLEDHCSSGPLWDPTLSAYSYSYNPRTSLFTPLSNAASRLSATDTPVNYLYFAGAWGDAQPGKGVKGQYEFFKEWRWIGGPKGPGAKAKNLGRMRMCRVEKGCIVRERVGV